MADAVSICNLALQRLGAKSISTLTEDTTRERECNRVYQHARDSELRAHPWGFAKTRVQVAADATAPTFGPTNRFALPADNLRVLPTNGFDGSSVQDDFQIEGRYIATYSSSPINLVYIRRVTDENDFDSLFIELLVSRIAMDTAEKLTQSNKKKEEAAARYRAAKNEARRINSFENPPQEFPEDSWIMARH